jgi:hypothetical protein
VWAAHPEFSHAKVEGTDDEADGFRRYVAEIDNLRAAVGYAVSAHRNVEACAVIAGFGLWAALRPTFEVLDWVDPTTIDADDWDDGVARAAGALGLAAVFGGSPERAVELLENVPDAWQDHFQMLNAKVHEALWIAQDTELAWRHIAAARPTSPAEELVVDINRGHCFQGMVHVDRGGDAAFAAEALRHTAATVERARAAGAHVSLVVALAVHGYCLEGSGDPAAAISVQTEALDLADALGLGAMVDAARVGLVESMSQVATRGGGDVAAVAAATRAGLELALARRSVFFALIFLGGAVERLLWLRGEHRDALVVGRFARRTMSNWASPSIIDTGSMSDEELAAIDAEADSLDLGSAGAIAIAALDRVIAASAP